MADARLDLEVVIDGADKAAKGLDDVSDSSNALRKASAVAGSDTDNLSAAFNGLTRGASAANAAQSAMAQLMAGNFVGAFKAATVAVRGLWTAMISNPYTLVAAAIATAISSLVLWKRHVDEVKRAQDEAARSMRNFVDDLNRSRGAGPLDFLSRQISDAEQSGDVNALVDARDAQAKKEETLFNRARILGASVAGGNEEDRSRAEEARRSWQDAKDALDMYNAAIARMQERSLSAPAPGAEAGDSASGSGGGSGEVDEWAGWRARFKDYVREKKLAQISDPMQRLKAELKLLEKDLADQTGSDVDSATRRLDLREKILNVERQIAAEQSRGAPRDSAARNDSAARRAADLRSIAGEKNLGDQWGPEVADGWKISEKRRRTLAGGRAGQWFGERNKERLALQGVGLSRTTEMWRPDIGADGKTNPAERTNQLLEKVVERLG